MECSESDRDDEDEEEEYEYAYSSAEEDGVADDYAVADERKSPPVRSSGGTRTIE